MAKRVPEAVIQEDQALVVYFDNASLKGRLSDDHPSELRNWKLGLQYGPRGVVRILDVETVWNHTVYQVWIPRLAMVERVPAGGVSPLAQPTKATGLDRITYAVTPPLGSPCFDPGRTAGSLQAGVIPLPHQLHALTRAVTDRVRYLLADEVGLGKAIEAD